MGQVTIEVGGRRYDVACRDGGEDRLTLLARLVDARTADAARAVGRGSETRELLLTALLLADELDETRSRLAEARHREEASAHGVQRCAERLEQLVAALDGADAGGPVADAGIGDGAGGGDGPIAPASHQA